MVLTLKSNCAYVSPKLLTIRKKIGSILVLMIFALSTFSMIAAFPLASAQASNNQLPPIVETIGAPLVYTPSIPIWNIYAPANIVAQNVAETSDLPLEYYDPWTNTFLPALASSVQEWPSNAMAHHLMRRQSLLESFLESFKGILLTASSWGIPR